MATDHLILCGTASGAALPPVRRAPVCLRMWGPHPNVFFKIEDVREGLWSEVPEVFLDLLDVATYVYSADQAVKRGTDQDCNFGSLWRRRLHFALPVRRPDFWNHASVLQELVATLSFLSEDEYHFHFEALADPPPADRYIEFSPDRFGGTVEEVLLFSGGLDSLAGAVLQAVSNGRQILLVNHRSNPKLDPVLDRLVRELALAAPRRPPILLPVRINKSRGLSRETTQRTRSFLYASLAATITAVLGLDRVCFYENGVVSLNLPPAAQVVGSRASRSTHPRVLAGMSRLLQALAGGRFVVENPFQWHTKAGVVQGIAIAGCERLIRHSRSCAHPRGRKNAQPHCGVCSQCIDRRFGVLAAGQAANDPADGYEVDLFTGERAAGHPQTMLAVYAETASQITRMGAARFFSTYGEVSRAVTHLGGDPEVSAQQIFRLYQEHARQVSSVIDEGTSRYRVAIRERTLPPHCLVRMVCGEAEDEPSPITSSRAKPATGNNVFRRKGDAWVVRFAGGEDFTLLARTGAAYLHLLLQRPGCPISAAELACRVAGNPERFALGSAGRVLSEESLAAYRVRYTELAEEIAKAEKAKDAVLLEQLKKERLSLGAEVARAQGLGGRRREASDDRERCRKAVTMAITRAVRRIDRYDSNLAKHLRPPQLRCGDNPCYDPSPRIDWET
jgi:hypothetical protein